MSKHGHRETDPWSPVNFCSPDQGFCSQGCESRMRWLWTKTEAHSVASVSSALLFKSRIRIFILWFMNESVKSELLLTIKPFEIEQFKSQTPYCTIHHQTDQTGTKIIFAPLLPMRTTVVDYYPLFFLSYFFLVYNKYKSLMVDVSRLFIVCQKSSQNCRNW